MRVRKPEKAIKEFFSNFPEAEGRRAAILQAAADNYVVPELMRFFLYEESDNYVSEVFTFSEAEIAALAPQGHAPAMLNLMREWSIEFGALEEATIDHLYMANPVWARPFILLEDGRYFWPNPASFHSFAFEMFERIMSSDARLLVAYEDARAVALEEEVRTLAARAFPASEVLRNLKWVSRDDGQEYENDFVILIDRVAILIEAKSGKVAPEAKRGADLRLLREVEKLMVEPAQQSQRLLRHLTDVRGRHTFDTPDGERVINSTRIDTFIRLNVTFSVIGAVSSRWPELVEAGLIASSFEPVPTMSIADLDTVCEVLHEQSTIVHYLRRRASFEVNALYKADEIDLLAFYLDTGFNIGEEEFNGLYLNLYGGSDELNSLYKRRAQGEKITPRAPARSALFKRLIAGIEASKGEGWLERAYRLLNVAMGDQLTIEGSIKSSISTVKRSPAPSESWSGQLSNGPPQRKEAIAFVWYRCPTRESRSERLLLHAVQAMEMAGTNDCLVVGFDVEHPPQAFSVMGLIGKPSNGPVAIYRSRQP